jgi:hypothetical protein
MNFDDETLMAYVDGEVDAKLRADIDAAIANDPAVARRVEHHRAVRAKVSGAFAKVLDQPLPDRLLRAARGAATPESAPASEQKARGNVLQFPARPSRPPATPWRGREWAAMAASLLLGALISWKVLVTGDGAPIVAGTDSLVAHGALARALDAQLASEQQGSEPVLIGLTFKAQSGGYCRSFELRATRTAGLACREGAEWKVTTTDATASTAGQMQQAGSALSPAILRAIEARVEGTALDAEAERSAQEAGWKAASK